MYLENLDRSLIIIEIYQLFLFALILLFYGYKKTTSKKILAVFFLDAGIYYLALGMYYLGNYQITVLLYHFFVPAILALYPLFYLYVKSLTNQNFSLDSRKLFHFLPSLLFFLINTPVFVMLSPEQSKWFVIYGFTETGTGFLLQLVTKIYYLWNFVVFPLQIIFYTYLIIKKIREHKNLIKELFSNLQKKQLNWMM